MATLKTTTDASHLDQLSITQTPFLFCPYGAPLGAFRNAEQNRIYQTCCNHWNCPVCWRSMAASVRRRIVHGAGLLSDQGLPLFFWTFTCRGRDLHVATADDDYYEWTNKALTNLRQQASRDGQFWAYVQVTERQQRGAAHSHFVITYCPGDSEVYQDAKGRFTLISDKFSAAVVASGLGPQCQITVIDTPAAVAHYISGYLEKHVNEDVWPSHWRRVRYSRKWPPAPETDAFVSMVLRSKSDWQKLDNQHCEWFVDNADIQTFVRHHAVTQTIVG